MDDLKQNNINDDADSVDIEKQEDDNNDTNSNDMLRKANAMIFVSNLQTNVKLKQQWTSLLQKMKEKLDVIKADQSKKEDLDKVYSEKLVIVNNFLAANGYNTTAADVLDLLKSDFYEEHQKRSEPNESSDDFVQKLLGNSKLMAAWQKALNQSMNGTENAADNFLKTNNIDCNIDQVRASFIKMRNHKLSYWSGIYGNSIICTNDGKSQTGPVITIYDDRRFGVGNQIVDFELNKVKYEEGVLSWEADDFTINFSGKITFNQVSRPVAPDTYVGNEFFGTFIYPSDGEGEFNGECSIIGRIGKPVSSESGKQLKTPPSVQLDTVDKMMKYVGYFMAGVFAIDFIASIPGRITSIKKGAKSIKDFFSKDKKSADSLEKAQDSLNESSDEAALKENGTFDQNSENAWSDDPSEQNMEGLNKLSDEALPVADGENIEALEKNVEKIEEDGKISSSENDYKPEEGEVEPDVQPEEAEDIMGDIGDWFTEV